MLRRAIPFTAMAVFLMGAALAQGVIIGIPRDSGSSSPSADTPQRQQHRQAVEAEVQRLGEHRRAEAEQIVRQREQAEAARKRSMLTPSQTSAATQSAAAVPKPVDPNRPRCIIAPTAPYGGIPQCPLYVARPNLPKTTPPKGFWDSNRFISVENPADAAREYEKQYGTCGGSAQYVTPVSACYADGQGRYSCQAVVRCKLNGGPSKARAQ